MIVKPTISASFLPAVLRRSTGEQELVFVRFDEENGCVTVRIPSAGSEPCGSDRIVFIGHQMEGVGF